MKCELKEIWKRCLFIDLCFETELPNLTQNSQSSCLKLSSNEKAGVYGNPMEKYTS